MPLPKKFFPDQHGVSLLEVVIALGIFAAATVVTSTYIFQGYTANRYALEMSDAVEHARTGIAAMAREVREARDVTRATRSSSAREIPDQGT